MTNKLLLEIVRYTKDMLEIDQVLLEHFCELMDMSPDELKSHVDKLYQEHK